MPLSDKTAPEGHKIVNVLYYEQGDAYIAVFGGERSSMNKDAGTIKVFHESLGLLYSFIAINEGALLHATFHNRRQELIVVADDHAIKVCMSRLM